MSKSYDEQIAEKQNNLISTLNEHQPKVILKPIKSQTTAFRNKAKMAVLGTVEKPILGVMSNGNAVDLCNCPLYSSAMHHVLNEIKTTIKQLQLVPYNINRKKGELKYILVIELDHHFMVRFVLRSEKYHQKLAQAVPEIQKKIPNMTVISINIQPEHSAILEGKKELILTTQQHLPVLLNKIPLFIRQGSFFQTNTDIAAQLYATAQTWIHSLNIHSIWDLFCGVGGFGLHCMTPNRRLTGIEINQEAIACAQLSAKLMGYDEIKFQSLDAAKFAFSHHEESPDLILVNPPRRGLGEALTRYLATISPEYILYSSCHLDSLMMDLQYLSSYQIEKVQLFDMFPHTKHMEVLVFLSKTKNSSLD